MMMIELFVMLRLRYNMVYVRTIIPISFPKYTGTWHKTIDNNCTHSFQLRQLIQSFTLFWFFRCKIIYYKPSWWRFFKLLYWSLLLQLSKMLASAIGTIWFAHANFEYFFAPQKSRESSLFFFFTVRTALLHTSYCQRFFNLCIWTNKY